MKKTMLSCLLFLAVPGVAAAQGTSLSIMAPSTPGGGWDVLARTIADVLKSTGREKAVDVYNVGGKAGTLGLADFVKLKGQPNRLMVTGFVMVAGVPVNSSPYLVSRDTTPIAGLVSANEVLVVPANSRFRTADDLLAALKSAPGSVKFGGSSLGGTSHVAFATIAQEMGIPVKNMQYVPSAGGLQAAKAMMTGDVDVVSTGYSEVDELISNGSVRVLAVLAENRLPGVNAPTLAEKGVKVDVANWRGVVAPAGISSLERTRLELQMQRLVRSTPWQITLKQNKWDDRYMGAAEFRRFIQYQENQLPKLLRTLDLIK